MLDLAEQQRGYALHQTNDGQIIDYSGKDVKQIEQKTIFVNDVNFAPFGDQTVPTVVRQQRLRNMLAGRSAGDSNEENELKQLKDTIAQGQQIYNPTSIQFPFIQEVDLLAPHSAQWETGLIDTGSEGLHATTPTEAFIGKFNNNDVEDFIFQPQPQSEQQKEEGQQQQQQQQQEEEEEGEEERIDFLDSLRHRVYTPYY